MGYTPIMRSGSCGYIVTNYKKYSSMINFMHRIKTT